MANRSYSGAKRQALRKRRLTQLSRPDAGGGPHPRVLAPDCRHTTMPMIAKVDVKATIDPSGGQRRRRRWATLGTASNFYNPLERVARAITHALDPKFTPAKVKTLADMTPEEIAALEKQYGCKVKK